MEQKKTPKRRSPYQRSRRLQGKYLSWLLVGCIVSFLVSLFVIRSLMEYVRKHNFSAFGVYRIVLGALVLLYFAVKSVVGVG